MRRSVWVSALDFNCVVSHRSAKTPNPDDPTPILVRGRESTCVTFVLENPHYRTAFIFAMEQS